MRAVGEVLGALAVFMIPALWVWLVEVLANS